MLYNIKVFKAPHLNDVLGELYTHVLKQGRESAPRGQRVLEAPRPVVLDLAENRSPWTLIPARKLNPYFALAEVVWILAGQKDVGFITYYNKNIAQFSNDGIEFDAAYGDRLRNWPVYQSREDFYYTDRGSKSYDLDHLDQIPLVCDRLKRDPSTRQAVLALWDPARDLKSGSKDYPCNNLCYFTLRDAVLDMSVVRRSNDMVWGLPYNQIQFYFIHALVAGELNARVGRYTEFVQNMHVYLDAYKPTLDVVQQRLDSLTEMPADPTPDMRITLTQFETFKNMFLEIERDWRCNYPAPKSGHVRAVAQLMEERGVPQFWSQTMLHVPLAYIAKKRGNPDLHDFLISQIDPSVLWLVTDANPPKEKL